MKWNGSAIESDDNRNLCPECGRETPNADLCRKCLKDREEGYEDELGEVIDDYDDNTKDDGEEIL